LFYFYFEGAEDVLFLAMSMIAINDTIRGGALIVKTETISLCPIFEPQKIFKM